MPLFKVFWKTTCSWSPTAYRPRRRHVSFQSTNTLTNVARSSISNNSYRSSVMTSSRKSYYSYVEGSVVSFKGLTDEPHAKWCCPCPSGPPPIEKVTECAIAPCDHCGAYGDKKCYRIKDDDKTRRDHHYCVDCGDKTETTTNTHHTATDEQSNECMDPMPASSEFMAEMDILK